MRLLLIGAGQWGKNYVSTIAKYFPDIELQIGNRDTWQHLIDAKPDGVIVATPPGSHIEIAERSLQSDIPTMIEKPLALSYQEACKLQQYKAPILVNHIHLFACPYQWLREMIVIDKCRLNKIVSLGFNKGPVREYSSLWDYGCHDLAMILDLIKEYPSQITATETQTETGSLFNIKLKFKDCETESLVGNGGQKSVRKLKINYNGVQLTYDDKLHPKTDLPPLVNAIRVLEQNIREGIYDYRFGLDLSLQVVKILEECQNQL